MALTVLALAASPGAYAQPDRSRAQPLQAFANSGAAAAQPAFGRGVTALHNFAYRTAADAFREAQALDPDFALAYWGEAMTHAHLVWGTEDLEAGRRALQRRSGRSDTSMTSRERGYLAAAEALFGSGERETRMAAFEVRMRDLHQAYPDDVEAAAFHALALIRRGPQQAAPPLSVRLRAATILEPLVQQHPRHPGILHYLIHAYDDPAHAGRALAAAGLYEQIAMKSPHALHMPSHVYLRLGLWDETARANTAAYEASIETDNPESHGPDLHALEWLHFAELQRGRLAAAAALLQTMRRHGDRLGAGPARAAARMAARAVIATHAWEGAILPKGGPYLDLFLSHGNAVFAAGLAAAVRGDEAVVGKAIESLDHLRRSAVNANLGRWAERIGVMTAMVAAERARRAGDRSLARTSYEQAAHASDRLEGDAVDGDQSLPNPAKPARELYGEALLAWGEADAAQTQFDAVLQRNPRRPAALLGLARTLAMRGERAAAACRYAALAQIWHAADAGMPGVEEARQRSGSPQDCPKTELR